MMRAMGHTPSYTLELEWIRQPIRVKTGESLLTPLDWSNILQYLLPSKNTSKAWIVSDKNIPSEVPYKWSPTTVPWSYGSSLIQLHDALDALGFCCFHLVLEYWINQFNKKHLACGTGAIVSYSYTVLLVVHFELRSFDPQWHCFHAASSRNGPVSQRTSTK